ncbi:MAG: hypothetical protein IPM39_13405 [Chloroflexi bacterium]|nr:hypothetical protein [Chloroflexota bacterium]
MKRNEQSPGGTLPSSEREAQMLRALNAAVASLQKAAYSETAVYDAFGAQLQNLGLHGAISMLSEERTQLVVKALVIPKNLHKTLRAVEKLLGVKGVGYRYSRATAVIDQHVIATGESLFLANNTTFAVT